jgi:shikimate kinase
VVLVGFMCSGKSTVGRALAERLGWRFVDLDREVERRAGLRVAEIFAAHGEPAFRAAEAAATDEAAMHEGVVLAPGGGWITNPALLDRLGPGTLAAWLTVSPGEVLRRAAASPGERPLLLGPDPAGTVRRLLAERERFYARADLVVPTDGRDLDDVVLEIERELIARGVRAADSRAT